MNRTPKSGKFLTTVVASAIAVGSTVIGSTNASAVEPAADAPGVAAAKKVVSYLSTYPTKIGISVPLT